jgi:quercetin dioxygenase-like cupin family protein
MKQHFSTCSYLAMLIGIAIYIPAYAGNEHAPKSHEHVIYQAPFTGIGIEGKEVVIIRFEISPGYVGDKHMHPGPTYVYVLEGELKVKMEGETKTFKAGEVYAMGTGQPVTGMNPDSTEDLEILVFQIRDIDKPTHILVE